MKYNDHVYTSLSIENEILHTSVSSTGVIVIVLQFLSPVRGHMIIFYEEKEQTCDQKSPTRNFHMKRH